MKKHMKKLFASVMALAMVFSLLPMAAFAADAEEAASNALPSAFVSTGDGANCTVAEADGVTTITLTGDVTLTEKWTINNNVVLVGNSHSIKGDDDSMDVYIEVNGSLTISEVTLTDFGHKIETESTNQKATINVNEDGKLTATDVTFKNFNRCAINIIDAGKCEITNCQIDAGGYFTDGYCKDKSETKDTYLLKGIYIRNANDVTVKQTDISGVGTNYEDWQSSGIEIGGASDVTLEDVGITVKDYNKDGKGGGIAITHTSNDVTVTIKGEDTQIDSGATKLNGNKLSFHGFAVRIMPDSDETQPTGKVKLNIEDGTFNGDFYYRYVGKTDGAREHIEFNITGGKFKVDSLNVIQALSASGVTLANFMDAEGYVYDEDNGYYVVRAIQAPEVNAASFAWTYKDSEQNQHNRVMKFVFKNNLDKNITALKAEFKATVNGQVWNVVVTQDIPDSATVPQWWFSIDKSDSSANADGGQQVTWTKDGSQTAENGPFSAEDDTVPGMVTLSDVKLSYAFAGKEAGTKIWKTLAGEYAIDGKTYGKDGEFTAPTVASTDFKWAYTKDETTHNRVMFVNFNGIEKEVTGMKAVISAKVDSTDYTITVIDQSLKNNNNDLTADNAKWWFSIDTTDEENNEQTVTWSSENPFADEDPNSEKSIKFTDVKVYYTIAADGDSGWVEIENVTAPSLTYNKANPNGYNPNAGSGGSSSSNSSSSSTATNPDGSTTTTTVDKATGTVTVIDKAADGSVDVNIDATAKEGTTEVKIPSSVIKTASGAEEASLTVALPDGTVALDETALESITKSGRSVTVSVEQIDADDLSDEHKEILGDKADVAIVVDVNLLVGGKKQTSFNGGKLTISIPYTPKAGEDTSNLSVWYINDDGMIENMGGYYDAETGCFVFETNHLSQYLLVNAEINFADVADGTWYHDAVYWAALNDITVGMGGDLFAPDMTCTRAQLVTFVWRAAGQPAATGTADFTDVAADEWYTDAVNWAASTGLVEGYGNGQFGTDGVVTREQVVTILYRYATSTALNVEKQNATSLNDFSDAASVSAYAVEAMQWAINTGVIQGDNNNVMPLAPCTRAQIVTILYRLLNK